MPQAPGTRLGPYEIVALLGAGGMGEVYRARDVRLGRQVALKLLPERVGADRQALDRFLQEARAASSLSHPNICTVFDVGEEGDRHFIVMELLEGQTLEHLLAAGPLPLDRLLALAAQIAEAVEAAHAAGILHRDLKPANLFVTERGQVKVLDFGLAKLARVGGGGAGPADATMLGAAEGALTAPGTSLGTVGYMSPEQALGREVDARGDVFSLGAVLYQMATGRQAFAGETAAAVFDAILHRAPAPADELRRDLPAELVVVVERALAKDPAARYPSVAALRADLAQVPRAGTAGGPEEPPSIAVLPFANMSADPENEYFTDGMAEEIINSLCKIEALRVASRTSSFAFKGKLEDIRKIGRTLSVSTVLEGSVRKIGQRLRVTAQLIKVDDGYHLWSERFDRNLEDVFAVQDEIARAIVETLKVRLLGSGDHPLVAPTTKDVEAYNLYLKGRYFWNRRQTRPAIEQFEAAVARDPDYATAYTGLADSYAVWGFYGGIPPWEAFARARAAAERAQELAPGSAGVHLSLGIIEHYYGWDTAREERELRLAIEQNPRSQEGYFWLSLCYAASGRFEESRETAQRGVDVEPHSANARAVLGWAYAGSRRFGEALPEFSRAVALDPQAAFPVWCLGYAQQQVGKLDEAIATLERAVALTGREHFFELALYGSALAAGGREAEARKILAELRERATRTYVPPFDLALLLTSLGEREEALSALERAYDERNALLWYRIHMETFDPLRGEPRWRALADRLARTAPLRLAW